MSFLDRFFGGRQVTDKAPPQDEQPAVAPVGNRRELLRVVLREAMAKHGIPAGWIGAELLPGSAKGGREPDLHVRLLIRHFDPRLLACGVAFQRSLHKRLEVFDPQSASWLTGFSWQFALADESACPPMPEPAVWQSQATPAEGVQAAQPAAPATPPLEDRKAALNRLLDGDIDKEPPGNPDQPEFEATQPMVPLSFEATQPIQAQGFEDTQRLFVPTTPGKL
ncbi:MAG TPA: hypothetical protein VLJ58_11100 [Ramlibacter sp.]|nr:hypothetical protein [Ramlibacter sp.]